MKADEISLRPMFLSQYKGQNLAVSALNIMIAAAKKRQEPLDHILIMGPGGLGKTTLANCIANEMNTRVKVVTAPNLDNIDDFRALLLSMEKGEILFIDEIHALSLPMVETLYTVMEDFYFDGLVKFKGGTSTVRVNIDTFTVIGATTNPEKLTPSLRTRFAQTLTLHYMTQDAMADLIEQSAIRLGLSINKAAAMDLAGRSRGVPRVANNLLRRVRDVAEVSFDGQVTTETVRIAMESMGIDKMGLDDSDRRFLSTIVRFGNKPMGIQALTSALRESRQVLEEIREPFLIEQGLVERTSKGRTVTELGMQVLTQ